MSYRVITDEQADHFLTKGYVKIEDCFPESLAQEWTDFAFERLGYTREDPSTWTEERIHMPSMNKIDISIHAPRAFQAMCDVMGGEDRIKIPVFFGDGLIANFSLRANEPWEPPSAATPGWHKDGDWFRHFLDTPEQGLLTLAVWSNIKPKSGGTFMALDSIPFIARQLLDHPEGLTPSEGKWRQYIDGCKEFVEATGNIGDVFLVHPYMLHAASQNPSGRPRFITNPAISLKEPMNFSRKNPDDYSLVERVVLRALKVDSIDFKATGTRERLVPERVARQRKMRKEQEARLSAV